MRRRHVSHDHPPGRRPPSWYNEESSQPDGSTDESGLPGRLRGPGRVSGSSAPLSTSGRGPRVLLVEIGGGPPHLLNDQGPAKAHDDDHHQASDDADYTRPCELTRMGRDVQAENGHKTGH